MDIFSIEKNVAAIDAGDWVSDIPNFPGVRLKVRGLGSETCENVRDAKVRALMPSDFDENGAPKKDVTARIAREVLHEAILIDWDGFTASGKAFPYSPESALPFCTEKRFEDFQDAVTWAARKIERVNTGKREALEKN